MKSFYDRLTEEESLRHTVRMAEISSMQEIIALAEPVIKKIEARINGPVRHDHRLPCSHGGKIALLLTAAYYQLTDAPIHDALLSFGFVEVNRSPGGLYDAVVLRKGALDIAVTTLPGHGITRKQTTGEKLLRLSKRRHCDAQVAA